VAKPIIEAFGGTVPAAWGGQLPQEHMINVNAGVCMTLAFLAGYLTSRMRALTAMAIGIGISCIAIWALGLSMNGWFTIAAVAGFSLGEITASPRKAEYLASLAPKGREGLYLGYVNATQAIGWSLGSLLAGRLYEAGGDKVVLARRMLVDRFGQDQASVAELAKTDVVPRLQELAGLDATATTTLLWDTYQPNGMWTIFALVGVSSMVCLFLYGFLVKRIEGNADGLFTGLAVAYTWVVHDQHAFTSVPVYSLGFGFGMVVYILLRRHRPEWLPQGANASG
jgi:hypothetical protein